jgi:hypothetical protein
MIAGLTLAAPLPVVVAGPVGTWTAALRLPAVPAAVAFQPSAQVTPGRLEPIDREAEDPLRLFGVRIPGECPQRDAHDPLRLFAVAAHRPPAWCRELAQADATRASWRRSSR